ncbi:hypothetical protein CW304_13370 [Bacillus sp. UFRGS-B20]|nr:hypothetical protein CW304_13370 [Bacillus sp. UFRGS-B20]
MTNLRRSLASASFFIFRCPIYIFTYIEIAHYRTFYGYNERQKLMLPSCLITSLISRLYPLPARQNRS